MVGGRQLRVVPMVLGVCIAPRGTVTAPQPKTGPATAAATAAMVVSHADHCRVQVRDRRR